MKALSLTQPWATLVAIGSKQYETRSWQTSYRGPLLIHAAKGFPAFARRFAYAEYTLGRLPRELPRGAIIAKVTLAAIYPTLEIAPVISPLERLYGDYGAGRFAWLFEDVELFDEPIPYKGRLGVFEVPHE